MSLFRIIFIALIACPLFGQDEFLQLEDGTSLYLEDVGQGQTLLFIPGWKMTHRFFDRQQDHFSKQYRVITYDPRGQGRSDKTAHGNNYAEHAADLRQLLTKRQLNNVVLIGWSSGCLTIYEYVRAFGFDRIDKMVFIDEPPKWVGDSDTEWVYGSFEDYRSSLKDLVAQRSDNDGIINWMLELPVDSLTRNWMNEEINRTPPHVSLSLYVDGLISDYTREVATLTPEVPALFMVRASWHERAANWLKTAAPSSTVVPISSHAMFWERPEPFNRLLTTFLITKN